MARQRQQVTEAQRAILIAELSAGASLRAAAAAAQVSKHVAEIEAASLRVRTQLKGTPEWLERRLWELVDARFDFLVAAAKLGADPAWLRQHGPAEVATLMGTTDDKLIRLLAAIGRGGGEQPDSDGDPGTHPPRALPSGNTRPGDDVEAVAWSADDGPGE